MRAKGASSPVRSNSNDFCKTGPGGVRAGKALLFYGDGHYFPPVRKQPNRGRDNRVEWSKAFPSEPSVLEEWYGWLEKALMRLSADPKWQYRVTVATGEAFTNAIFHGNRAQPDKKVRVDIELSDKMLWVKVGDQGEGSEPRAKKKSGLFDTSGRGWELMHRMADLVKTAFRGGYFWVELGFKMPKNIEAGKRGKHAGKIGSGGG